MEAGVMADGENLGQGELELPSDEVIFGFRNSFQQMVDDFEHSVLFNHVELLERTDFFGNDWQYFLQVIDTQTFQYILDDGNCQRLFNGRFS